VKTKKKEQQLKASDTTRTNEKKKEGRESNNNSKSTPAGSVTKDSVNSHALAYFITLGGNQHGGKQDNPQDDGDGQ
jgi:hypothetical protein